MIVPEILRQLTRQQGVIVLRDEQKITLLMPADHGGQDKENARQ
jgi:hypothetical protein